MKRDFEQRKFERMIFAFDKWVYLDGWRVANRQVKDIPAVYCIYGDGKLIYVGQSNWPRYRFTQHAFSWRPDETYKTPWGYFFSLHAKIKYPKKYGMESMIEKRLIKRLKPPCNKYKYKKREYCSL